MTEQTLNDIKEVLDDIKGILLFVNDAQIKEKKKKLLQKNSIEEQVYNICDTEITSKDISKKIQKKEGNVRKVLSNLRDKGLIKSIKKEDGTLVHTKRF